MADETTGVQVGGVEPPPCKRPLEAIERDGEWVVREYYQQTENAKTGVATFGTYDSRIDAMRDGQRVLKRRRHPCLLRWDTERSVGGLYWNPTFETLAVEYSALLNSWVVTARDDHFVFQSSTSTESAYQLGKLVLEEYDFKTVEFYTRDGQVETEREHRFLRHDIVKSGVRFERGQLPTSVEHPAPPPDESERTESESDDDTGEGATEVMNTLASVIPDITKLVALDVDGPVYRYRTPWDGDQAHVLILNPEHQDHRTLRHVFGDAVELWQKLAAHDCVATIHETGADPATWVVFDAADTTLAEFRENVSTQEQVRVLSALGSAVTAAQRRGIHRTDLEPGRIRVGTTDSPDAGQGSLRSDGSDPELSVSVSGLGLQRRVSETVNQYDASRYMAPEQLRQEATTTTPVYRLGAVAYWLLTGTEPFHRRQDFTTAVRHADLTPPHELAQLPSSVSDCIGKAMHSEPGARYHTGTAFVRALVDQFGTSHDR
ncbi:hypothetical protein [Halorientalis sp.]|uniref:hypothetical protein n=1 Tax=Halorientalis sp. TaxID=1931229 RepID=UPI0026167757|nr:hypothetical protein [Halorientalis sp.]